MNPESRHISIKKTGLASSFFLALSELYISVAIHQRINRKKQNRKGQVNQNAQQAVQADGKGRGQSGAKAAAKGRVLLLGALMPLTNQSLSAVNWSESTDWPLSNYTAQCSLMINEPL